MREIITPMTMTGKDVSLSQYPNPAGSFVFLITLKRGHAPTNLLALYVAAAMVASMFHRNLVIAAGHLILLTAILVLREKDFSEWLPWIALPFLYWAVPASLFGPMHDATVQSWDFTLFHSQPARDWAAAIHSRPLSEILHLAYLSYYLVIYLPPVAFLFILRDERGFSELTLAFTFAMVLSFVGFALFPVQGPRYEWGPSATVPVGPLRSFTLFLLERGSAHGTAFPSSHVAIAFAQTFSTLGRHWALGFWVGVTTVLLSVGAVYSGFHYATDVLAGMLVGIFAFMAAGTLARRALNS